MSVIISGEGGCIMDHNAALASASRLFSQHGSSQTASVSTYTPPSLDKPAASADAFSPSKNLKDIGSWLQSTGERTEEDCVATVIQNNPDTSRTADIKARLSNPLAASSPQQGQMCDSVQTGISTETGSMFTATDGTSATMRSAPHVPASNPMEAKAADSTSIRTQTCANCAKIQSDTGEQLGTRIFVLKKEFFHLCVPFLMDSQFEKVQKLLSEKAVDSGNSGITTHDVHLVLAEQRKKRKRKRSAHHEQERDEVKAWERLTQVYASLVTVARQKGIYQEYLPAPLDNNVTYRQCAQLDLDLHYDHFHNLFLTTDGSPVDCDERENRTVTVCSSGCKVFRAKDLIDCRVDHPCDEPCVVSVDGRNYILPPRCVFLLSNMNSFCSHLYRQISGSKYDLIVVDPPWENKSVKRKKSYDMVGEISLQNLPIRELAKPGSLVALWVTNNDRLEEFAMDELFPAWGVSPAARWHWLKVTQTGDMVTNLSESHKKPYEVLLLGRVASDHSCPASGHEGQADPDPPQSHVMISVPCSLHSKKLPLAEVLSPYLPETPRCLELFARNLWPGWTSWGREALRHQNRIFYQEVLMKNE